LRTWDFIDTHLIDRKNGEWFRGVTRDGRVLGERTEGQFLEMPLPQRTHGPRSRPPPAGDPEPSLAAEFLEL
jgi:hypothetical protein